MAKLLQELPSILSTQADAYMLVKQNNGAFDVDHKITVPNFIKGLVPRSMLGDEGGNIPVLELDSLGRPALPAISGEKLTNLTLPIGGSATDGLVKLSDSIDTPSNVTQGYAATPYAVKRLNDLKFDKSGGSISGSVVFSDTVTLENSIEMNVNNGGITFDKRGLASRDIFIFKDSNGVQGKIVHTETNNLDFVTSDLTKDILINGNLVWHQGNDGVNSGLDADLLDGLNSSDFLRSNAGTTYSGGEFQLNTGSFIKLNSSTGIKGYLGNNILTDIGNKNITISASGDGGDIYLGYHVPSLNYYTNRIRLRSNLTTSDGAVIATPTGQLFDTGRRVLTTADTGSGSGLNADLLDGLHASSFGQLATAQTWTNVNTFNSEVRLGTHSALGLATDAGGWSLETRSGTWRQRLRVLNNDVVGTYQGNGIILETSNNSWTNTERTFEASRGKLEYRGNTVWHSGNDSNLGKLSGNQSWSGANSFRSQVKINTLLIESQSSDHGYISYFTNKDSPNSRTAYMGFANTGTSLFTIDNERGGGKIVLSGSQFQYNNNTVWHSGNDSNLGKLSSNQTWSGDNNFTGQVQVRNTQNKPFALKRLNSDSNVDDYVDMSVGDSELSTRMNNSTNGASSTFKWQYADSSNVYRNLLVFSANDIHFKGNRIWNSGNDGSGSGLDADRLDGIESSQFLRSDVDDSINANLHISAGRGLSTGRIHHSVGGGHFETTTTTHTGYIKITLPTTWSYAMMSFWVDVYEYTKNHTFSVLIGGYNYASGWVNTSASIVGPTGNNYTVRFGHDGSKCCVWIGEQNTSWSYTQVSIRDFHHGYIDTDYSRWRAGWDITISNTSIPDLDATHVDCYTNAGALGGLPPSSYVRKSADTTLTGNIVFTGEVEFDTNFIGFNSPPVCSVSPTTDYQLVNKNYVDSKSSGTGQVFETLYSTTSNSGNMICSIANKFSLDRYQTIVFQLYQQVSNGVWANVQHNVPFSYFHNIGSDHFALGWGSGGSYVRFTKNSNTQVTFYSGNTNVLRLRNIYGIR